VAYQRTLTFFLLFLLTSLSVYADETSGTDISLTKYISPGEIHSNQELYQSDPDSNDYQNALFEALGWVNDPNGPSLRCQKCGGYYDESHFPTPSNLSFIEAPTTIKANPPVSYKVNGNVVFGNGVAIEQPGRRLYATNATLTPNLKTGKLDAISADNGIRMEQPGQLLLAKSLSADLVDHQAEMDQVNYLFKVGSTSPSPKSDTVPDPIFTGFAHGSASSVKQINADQYSLKDATYSTCAPNNSTWELQASTININQAEGEGQAYNTVLKIHGMPVFYLPYFNFPTNDQRKSGFLYGSVATAPNNGGLAFSIPYYFNLAPNFDDIFAPNIYTKRGILFTNDFRYLIPSSFGNVEAQFIPSDQQYDFKNRYSYSINDSTSFNSNWSGNLNYNEVSDQDFLSDFSPQNLFGANQTLLNRNANLNYQSLHWNVTGLLQSYQVVNPILTTANRPYQELPGLNATGQYPNILGPLSFTLATSYVNFQKAAATSFEISPVIGQRTNVEPTFALPLTASYGYITPALSVDNTFYNLAQNVQNGFPETTPSVDIPIFDIDTSLYFDRTLNLGGNSYKQTVAPRLFYLYVPYRNQNNIPIFDTSINTFDFGQLFGTNSFSGLDRVQNANQLSYALTTELDNPQGMQLLSAGIGQIYYFSNRLVTVCQNAPGSSSSCIVTENPYYNKHLSDVAGFFNYNFNPKWSFNSSLTYNPNISVVDTQNYTLQYAPNAMDVFNVGYQSNHQNYSLLSTQQILSGTAAPISSIVNGSFVYGLTPTWSVLGSMNYSIQNNGIVSEFAGVQYSACCWAVRLIGYKYVSNSNPNTPNILTGPTDTVYMVQFLLKGLGSNGGQGSNLLATIPGYHNQLGF
jgi:LPS-assembly protein